MNPLVLLALVIRDLLEYPEELIKLGRLNEAREWFDGSYIVVDSLAPAQPMARGTRYDGVAESLTLSSRMRQAVTIDFFGTDAYANTERLQLMLMSDQARYLQEQYAVTVGAITQITDVKALTGQQYGNRMQAELTIQYSPSITYEVLRIDTAVIESISD